MHSAVCSVAGLSYRSLWSISWGVTKTYSLAAMSFFPCVSNEELGMGGREVTCTRVGYKG